MSEKKCIDFFNKYLPEYKIIDIYINVYYHEDDMLFNTYHILCWDPDSELVYLNINIDLYYGSKWEYELKEYEVNDVLSYPKLQEVFDKYDKFHPVNKEIALL